MEAAELPHNSSSYWQLYLQGPWRLFPKVSLSVLALHSQHPVVDITQSALLGVSYVTLKKFTQALPLSFTDGGHFIMLLWVLISKQSSSLVC